MSIVDPEVEAKFWAKLDTSAGPDGCWPWRGSIRPDGYGRLITGRRYFPVHRLSWEIHYGEIPVWKSVGRTCRLLSCGNPAHLKLVA